MVAIGIVGIAILMGLMTVIEGDTTCPPEQTTEQCDSIFVPTQEDVMVLDTMLNQVQDIEKDLDTLHIRMDRIEDKIDDMLEEQKTGWHGREGRSEYGEYEAYSEWMEMQ